MTNLPSASPVHVITTAVEMIRTRRLNLRPYTEQELQWWIQSYTNNTIPEYQFSAWLMAVCLNGLSDAETAILTRTMVESGERIQWTAPLSTSPTSHHQQQYRPPPLVDKHSTGGVGDKVSIVLAPLVASWGVAVPMIAGRGLGHTGGTIDKLESIPGFNTQNYDSKSFVKLVQDNGCAIIAAGPTLCPADGKIYALRDVTDTVASIPLQTASIMSKKIAENPDSLVLDVKYGKGSFQTTMESAEILAKSMIATGEANGLNPTTAFLTRMDSPIGSAVGNWLEIKECIQIMKGKLGGMSTDLTVLICMQAAQMLGQSGIFPDKTFDDLVQAVIDNLKNGKALEKFRQMVQAQGGQVRVIDEYENYPVANCKGQWLATQDGYITEIDALTVGKVGVQLGAGRKVAHDPVDPCAGFWFYRKVGDYVKKGDVIADVYTNISHDALESALAQVQTCVSYSVEPMGSLPPIISHFVSSSNGTTAIDIPNVLMQAIADS